MHPENAIDDYLAGLDDMEIDTMVDEINEYLADVPGVTVEKIFELNGRYTACLEYRPCSTSTKGFHTPMYQSLPELAQSVMDTFAPAKGNKEIDKVNIFSSEMFEYLSAEMLGDKAVSMTIKSVVESELAGPRGTDMKVMIAFNERPKKLILNKTNARAIARVLGPETDNWKGATLTLGVENVKVGRNMVPSVRVKSASPAHRNGETTTPAQPATLPLETADEARAGVDTAMGLFD